MENNFRNQDFEEFLQNQLRNHRMYPADNVWRNIHKKLHGEGKWPALTIGALFILSATAFICFYFTPKPDIFAIKPQTSINNNTKNFASHNDPLQDINTTPFTAGKSSSYNYLKPHQENQLIASLPVNDNSSSPIADEMVYNETLESSSTRLQENKTIATEQVIEKNNNPEEIKINTEGLVNTINSDVVLPPNLIYNKPVASINFDGSQVKKNINSPSLIQQFKASKKKKNNTHLRLQVYVAPSISYRQLYEDRSTKNAETEGPVALNYVADVNTIVRHKPGTGIEAGFSFLYSLNKRVRVKAGLQFNVRQYSIEAYRSSTELANIALVNGNQLDTVSTVAMYRISNGYYSTDLINRYYQLSVPVGVEFEILGNKKIQWNVAGTIQPTYLVNRNAYMISSNFKNYTESPEMVRRWNLNSNIETFISFTSGDFKWQVGPQIRYQPNSTFIPQYPIKEHLLDYGLKLGVSKSF